MSTILIGVDGSDRSQDATALGERLASAAGADVILACAFPYSDAPNRAANAAHREKLRDEALATARAVGDGLEGVRSHIRVVANPSPAHALHDLAESERATLVIVGSTHTGRAGRVLPGSTGERLLHGAPCSVAVVPKGYREHAGAPIRRIGVAYDDSPEAKAAFAAAVDLARALGAELEVIWVVSLDSYASPALMAGPSVAMLREDVERHVQATLDELVAGVPSDVTATGVLLIGNAADELAQRSQGLDLLVVGSRGYGPLRSVIVGGVSGRVMRAAHCPVIVVPRGVQAPLGGLFETTAATA
ncbi:MAG TPA: universal stress protein [Solirubrobacter sp.]|nr:universal stress protein [Solirubrobacter sp.]